MSSSLPGYEEWLDNIHAEKGIAPSNDDPPLAGITKELSYSSKILAALTEKIEKNANDNAWGTTVLFVCAFVEWFTGQQGAFVKANEKKSKKNPPKANEAEWLAEEERHRKESPFPSNVKAMRERMAYDIFMVSIKFKLIADMKDAKTFVVTVVEDICKDLALILEKMKLWNDLEKAEACKAKKKLYKKNKNKKKKAQEQDVADADSLPEQAESPQQPPAMALEIDNKTASNDDYSLRCMNNVHRIIKEQGESAEIALDVMKASPRLLRHLYFFVQAHQMLIKSRGVVYNTRGERLDTLLANRYRTYEPKAV